MMITALSNDVSKKRKFWQLFANNNHCDFNYKQTPHGEVNILKLLCHYKNIKISFKESDAKPLICGFEIGTDWEKTIEISQITMFDRLYALFQKKHNTYTNPFLKKNKIKSNDTQVLNGLLKDNDLLNLLNSSEFFGLYAYTERDFLKVRITSTYFVNSYEKLVDIYSITCKIIGHLKQ